VIQSIFGIVSNKYCPWHGGYRFLPTELEQLEHISYTNKKIKSKPSFKKLYW